MKLLSGLWLNVLTSDKRLRLYVWLSLATQILIVVTGGLVRLTASGLGCPTWPKCTEESLVSTQEMGIHGIIEFGNRLLTFVLLIIALLTFATIFRSHPAKKNLIVPTITFFVSVVGLVIGLVLLVVQGMVLWTWSVFGLVAAGFLFSAIRFIVLAKRAQRIGILVPSFGLGLGIIAQALVGGITVLTQLNPWIVGLHFVISAYLIALAATMVFRALPKPAGTVAPLSRLLSWPIAVVSAVTILVGVLVTGAGPHAGDALTPRNGLDLEIWQHYHSYPGYLMLTLVLIATVAQARVSASLKSLEFRALLLLLFTSIAQAIVGVVQARMGVPPFLVGLHMLGAAVLSAMVMFNWLLARQKAR